MIPENEGFFAKLKRWWQNPHRDDPLQIEAKVKSEAADNDAAVPDAVRLAHHRFSNAAMNLQASTRAFQTAIDELQAQMTKHAQGDKSDGP